MANLSRFVNQNDIIKWQYACRWNPVTNKVEPIQPYHEDYSLPKVHVDEVGWCVVEFDEQMRPWIDLENPDAPLTHPEAKD